MSAMPALPWGRVDWAGIADRTLRPRPPADVWAVERRRIVGGARAGRFLPENAPMAMEVLRAFSDPAVERISVMAPAQLLKTETIITLILYSMAHGDPVLAYWPDLVLLRKFLSDRVRASLLAMGYQDEKRYGGGEQMHLKQRDSAQMLRMFGLAELVGLTPSLKTGKAAYSAPVVVIDELDKMGVSDMFGVADSRSISYAARRKIVAVSTPTMPGPGTIHESWEAGSRGVYRGRCPHCGGLTALDFDAVRFDRDSEGLWIAAADGGRCELACRECGAVLTELDRLRAIREGAYVHDRPEHPHRSYWVPGCAHLWRTVADIQSAGAKAYRGAYETGDWAPYVLWRNEVCCDTWDDAVQRGLAPRVMRGQRYDLGARSGASEGLLDERVLLVAAGADVGLNHIKCEWVAFGLDSRGQVLRWGLGYTTFGGGARDTIQDPALREAFRQAVMERAWMMPGGVRPIGAMCALIDAGYETDTVRDWCSEWQEREAYEKGWDAVGLYDATIIPWKSTRQGEEGALVNRLGSVASDRKRMRSPAMLTGDHDLIKEEQYDSLARDRRMALGEEAMNRFPADREARGYDDAWFREFTSEIKVVKRSPRGEVTTGWEFRSGAVRRNHSWDCRIYANAAARHLLWPHGLQEGLARDAGACRSAGG